MNCKKSPVKIQLGIVSRFQLFALLLLLATSVQTQSKTLVSVDNAWSPMAPPTLTTRAGYFTLHNLRDEHLTIVSITSPTYAVIEIHQSRIEKGIATMEQKNTVTIAGKKSLTFAPAGLHLMLMSPTQSLVAGDRFPLTVKFQKGRAHNFEMIVGNLNGDKKTASSLGATSHEHKHH